MRQNLSRALFVAAAATSILPLYGGAAFADSRSDVPPNACGSPSATGASLNPSLEKHCDAGPNPHAAARNFDNSENFTRLGRSHAGGSAGADEAGYGDDSGYGDDETGYGDDSGYGDDETGYGDTPTTPPTTQPPTTQPPTTPPPVNSEPPTSTPTTPPTSSTPDEEPPAEPPSLAETGSEQQVLVASGLAAILTASGVVLYRKGRAISRR
ncbi:LPXTG cell wall anchor domain-containing protein [Streptomyces sp. NPDC006265]|uniref:LPXTG cell wall anchor domain-containing protein n=1 Tax=Streptomyces sp. NPDC006265 TaxID=3156740 RepID=UPI0033AB25F7